MTVTESHPASVAQPATSEVELQANRSSGLDLSNIQGNIVPGFNKDHQAFVLVRFDAGPGARAWLDEVRHEVASAEEVATFNELFKRLRNRRKAAPGQRGQNSTVDQNYSEIGRDFGTLRTISSTWINVAFTRRGLQTVCGTNLEVPAAGLFEGRVFDSELTPAAHEPDAILLLGADWLDDLTRELSIQTARLERHQLTIIDRLYGDTRVSIFRGHEYFGYKDGISQPNIPGTQTGSGAPIQPGEFILGYPGETAPQPQTNPGWLKDGSFLVFLRLGQDVAGFERGIADNFATAGFTSQEQLGAAFVGRWRSGILAGTSPEEIRSTGSDPDPGFSTEPGSLPEQEDPYPFSHIGRANPRDPGAQSNRHRLIRRGIPYAMYGESGSVREQGLLFLAYQADMHEQFEHVWRQWLNGPGFPTAGAGVDPLVGQLSKGENARSIRLPDDTKENATEAPTLRLPQFVTPKFCSYLFAPSISALALLAGDAGDTFPMADEKQLVMARFAEYAINDAASIEQYLNKNELAAQRLYTITQRVTERLNRKIPSRDVNGGASTQYSVDGAELGNFILRGIPYGYDPGAVPNIIIDPQPTTIGSPAAAGLPPYNTTAGVDPQDLKRTLIDGPACECQQGKTLPKTVKAATVRTDSGDTQTVINEETIRNNPNQSLWWYFDGTPYRVVKAVRVAYTVKDSSPDIPPTFPQDGPGNLIRHFLIGYMGVDPSGG